MSGKIEGKVISISPNGDLVTDITAQQLEFVPTDERVRIECDEHETNGIFRLDHQEPESTFLAFINAEGRLSLQIVGLSASEMLGIREGQSVTVQW